MTVGGELTHGVQLLLDGGETRLQADVFAQPSAVFGFGDAGLRAAAVFK